MEDNLSQLKLPSVSKHNVSLGLGIFSLVLGASEIFLTRALARQSGLDQKYSPLLRAFGFREVTSGVGLLAGRNEQAWLWSRVIGDALDVGFLTFAFLREKDSEQRKRIAIAAAAVSPIVALDVINVIRKDGGEDLDREPVSQIAA